MKKYPFISLALFFIIALHTQAAPVACCYTGGECAIANGQQQCRNTGGTPAASDTCDPNPCKTGQSTETESPQASEIIKEETVAIKDLEIVEPTLLPSHPFYFFKNFTRGVRRVFTFGSVRKAELELRFTDEKIAEAKKLAETSPERTDALARAVENYQQSQEALKNRLESLRETSQNPNVDRLLEKLADRAIKHEKLFAELKEKFKNEKELGEKIDAAEEKVEENLVKAAEKDDPEKFVRRLEKALVETRGSDLKHVRSLEIIDRINQKAPEELKKEISAIREDFSERLKEDLEEFAKKHKDAAPELIKNALQELPGDKAHRLVLIEELRARAEKRVGRALEDAGKVIEEALKEREEIANHAQAAIRHGEERIRTLKEKLREAEKPPAAVLRLAEEAVSHLQNAIKAFNAGGFGEAFGQARSAEVLARNALRILEDVSLPENEDLREDVAELEERLREWEARVEKLSEEFRKKAKETLEQAQFHLSLARQTLEKKALSEAEKHLKEARSFLRLVERIFFDSLRDRESLKPSSRETPASSRKDERPAQQKEPAAAQPAAAPSSARHDCDAIRKTLQELKESFLNQSIGTADYERKTATLQEQLTNCVGGAVSPQTSSKDIICTEAYKPVCGENGKTYSNSCYAKRDGVSLKYEGECGKPESSVEPPAKLPAIAPSSATDSSESVSETARVSEFKVEADDNGFYPSNLITVDKGSKVKLHFIVRSSGVYYGGLDFRSSKFKTETVKPGNTASVEFSADESFKVTSYWPLTDTPKAILTIEVK